MGELCAYVSRPEAEDLVQRSVERALSGRCQVEHIGGVHAWVRQDARFALSHLLDRRRTAERKLALEGQALPRADEMPGPDDDLARADNVALAQRLIQEARLSEVDQKLVRLYWGERLPRKDVAGRLGLPEGTVKKRLARAGATFENVLIKRCGGGCGAPEEQFVRAYAFQHRDNAEALALEHIAECEVCAALFKRLEQVRMAVAAMTPIPLYAGTHSDALQRAAGRLAEIRTGSAEHVGGVTKPLREGVAHLKAHLITGYARTVELAPLSNLRTGAGAALMTSCLAAAGGATYCVKQGLDPIGVPSSVVSSLKSHKTKKPASHHKPAAPKAQVAQVPLPSVAAPPPVVKSTTTIASSTSSATKTSTTPKPAPEDEFEPTGVSGTTAEPAASASTFTATPTSTSSTSISTSSKKTYKPAPAPADGPGEFDGP